MNWLGKVIQTYIDKNDTVLDVGCGIMQATTDILGTPGNEGNLRCKLIVGVDIYPKYLDRIKSRYPTIHAEARQTGLFVDKSYDVVLCLDVLEHLPNKETAFKLLTEMKRIARKHVIAYTPKEFHTNEDHAHESWGMGENNYQTHHILVTQNEFKQFGYEVSTTEIDRNTLAICSLQAKNITRKRLNTRWWNQYYIQGELYQIIQSRILNIIIGAWKTIIKLLQLIQGRG